MSSKGDRPKCLECALEAADPTRLTEIDELSAEELDGWEKIKPFEQQADAIHDFDEGGLVGVYHLEDQIRLCSYEDHEHQIGFCAWSRCHRLLLLGKDCAKKYIPRYEEWIRSIGDTRKFQAERKLMEDTPIEILESLTALAASFERCHAGLENLKRYRRPVYEAVRNGYLRRELGVQVQREEPETETSPAQKVWVTELLQGTAIFEERSKSLRITLEDVRSKVEQARAF